MNPSVVWFISDEVFWKGRDCFYSTFVMDVFVMEIMIMQNVGFVFIQEFFVGEEDREGDLLSIFEM